jgi:1,4-alpha-glucan branching enzyme
MSFVRKGKSGEDVILAVLNFTPVPRLGYRVGVPGPGSWAELLNTDWGSNVGDAGGVYAEFIPMHGQKYSVLLNLPPLGAVFFKGRQ